MNIKNERNIYEEVRLKDNQDETFEKIIANKDYHKIIYLSIIINISFITGISLIIYNTIKNNFEYKLNEELKQKDIDIEILHKQLNNAIQEKTVLEKKYSQLIELKEKNLDFQPLSTSIPSSLTVFPNSKKIKTRALSNEVKEYEYDKNLSELNSMSYMEILNILDYSLLWSTNSMEKELPNFKIRPFCKYNEEIIKLLNPSKNNNYENDISFINGKNHLEEYKKNNEEHNLKNKRKHKTVSNFLKEFKDNSKQKHDEYILSKEELQKDYSINYKKFKKSKHLIQNYNNQELKMEDIKESIKIAKYSLSANNIHNVKVHYYPQGKSRRNVIDYPGGKESLYLDDVNSFIITFYKNELKIIKEKDKTFLNVKLFINNFINELGSHGINTCFIPFSNSTQHEDKLKQLNNIPSNERIAAILFAASYNDTKSDLN